MSTNKRSRAAYESSSSPPNHAPYALYGTPLPAFDSDARDDGSYVPVWKQEVTDERGRKRLHGAFTGGWSAGYFNTVGSKEGWTPATFVSSRSKKVAEGKVVGKQQQQRVEDFMDEEDFAAREEAVQLETVGAFAGFGSTAAEEGGGKGMFADLFRSTGETMGVKLLQRMGWRQGQGVGPRVRRKAKGDEKGEVHLFAPENSRMVSFERKSGRRGVGFAGEGRLDWNVRANNNKDGDEDSEQDARILQTGRSKVLGANNKPKKGLKKPGALGVGVLNDTGSDEDNDYDMGPKISYNRVIGGDKKTKKTRGGLIASAFVQKPPTFTPSKKLTQRTTALNNFHECHDGRLPLEGFVLISTPLSTLQEQEHKYPPPTVPEGWKPAKSSSAAANPATPATATYHSTADAAKTSTLDPKARAALLGEQQLPGKSVFDFLTPSARARLATASGKSDLPAAGGEKAPAGFSQNPTEQRRNLWDLVPNLDKTTASAALERGRGGFMPYAADEGKRNRYVAFLTLRAGQGTTNNDLPERAKGASTEDWVKELREFAQAAQVFRPISSLMSSRFVPSTTSASPRLASDAPDVASSAGKKEEDPAETAAKLGMFGPGLTRSRQQFYPTRLLCKRFNVRPPAHVDPASGPDNDNSFRTKEVVSQASLDRMMQQANFGGRSGFVSAGTEGGGEDAVGTKTNMVVQQPERERIDVEKNEALEGQRAGEAVFRAIFGSEDEDDD